MGIVKKPMSVAGWLLVDTYAQYARLVQSNLSEGRYFEGVAAAVVCLDVLLHHIVEGLLVHHRTALDFNQIQGLCNVKQGRLTGGQIISHLDAMNVLSRRLVSRLRKLNEIRNAVVHPFERGKLKTSAIVPGIRIKRQDASAAYRLLCDIIDIAGGVSPRKQKREQESYLRERRKERNRWQ